MTKGKKRKKRKEEGRRPIYVFIEYHYCMFPYAQKYFVNKPVSCSLKCTVVSFLHNTGQRTNNSPPLFLIIAERFSNYHLHFLCCLNT